MAGPRAAVRRASRLERADAARRRNQRFRALYLFHMDARRERMFLSSLAFFLTFGIVRAITHAIRLDVGPFHNVSSGGVHVHHLVWGILLLLGVGYLWLLQVGTGETGKAIWLSRTTSVLFGVAAALTLDEFALWLNLADVYFARQGRESIDAVLLFGGLLSIGVWGHPFLRGLARELLHPGR
jgi:hypothetical protein